MIPTNLNSFFSTTRNFNKWVVNASGNLVSITGNTIPIDYSPTTRHAIGIIIDPPSRNYFIDSEGLNAGYTTTSNVTRVATPIAGSSHSIRLLGGNQQEEIDITGLNLDTDYVAVSFFVKQSDNSIPTIGYFLDDTKSISFRINGESYNVAASQMRVEGPMSDDSYRVRIRMPVYGGQLTQLSIIKPIWSQVSLNISRIQIEKNVWTSYIPTSGTSQSRNGETIYRELEHNKEFNKDQGTIEIGVIPTPGVIGSAATLRSGDWNMFIALAHQYDTEHSDIARIDSVGGQFLVPLRASMFEPLDESLTVRASYSGYGVRVISSQTNRIGNLKDFNFMTTGQLSRIQFGESFDGTHFCGTLQFVNMYARTFNDAEMMEPITA